MSEPVIDYNFILDNSSPDSIISALSQVIGVLIDSKAEQSVGGIDIGVGSDGWIRIRSDLQLKRRVAPKQDESSDTTKQYARRNPMVLDKAGGYYVRHVMAMTREGLHAKSHIAAELACRDFSGEIHGSFKFDDDGWEGGSLPKKARTKCTPSKSQSRWPS